MEYTSAPMKGTKSNLILLGHLLGSGLRHSSRGSGFSGLLLRGRCMRRACEECNCLVGTRLVRNVRCDV